jgi:DNA-binding transcriptional LysR family regulator
MDRELFPHLPVVLAVARRGGFAAAAAELGMTASNASRAVRLLEERLGMPLFARTTRSVALTEAGAALVAGCGPALQEIARLWEQLRARRTGASGLLRLNVPRVALPLAVTPVLQAMADRFPDVTVEAFVDDGLIDIVTGRFDAGIRLGEMIAQDMVAVRLTEAFRVVIVASPAYLARHGRPQSLGDLERHNCIGFRQVTGQGLYRWELQERGQDVRVETKGTAIVTDPVGAVEFALAGIGLAYVFAPLVCEHLASGRLEEVLAESAIQEPGLFLYYPRRAAMAPKLRAFIDTAREVLGFRAGGC